MDATQGRAIQFHFGQPADSSAVEKDAASGKRKYLTGVATGLKQDQTGERVTEKCIDSIVRQAQAGDVLLFPDVHGMGDSKDIGILESFRVLDNGDWYVEFRLYDASDGVGQDTLETIDKIWKQINGLPPYKKPRKKGFSIEGYIPTENGLIKRDQYNQIDEIVLQGAIITPIPAYKDSVAHAVYKALGERSPWAIRKDIKSRLYDAMIEKETRDDFERERWDIGAALDDVIKETMTGDLPDKEGALRIAFDEYRDLMVDLILKSAAIYQDGATDQATDEASPYSAGTPRGELLGQLRTKLVQLAAIRKERKA